MIEIAEKYERLAVWALERISTTRPMS